MSDDADENGEMESTQKSADERVSIEDLEVTAEGVAQPKSSAKALRDLRDREALLAGREARLRGAEAALLQRQKELGIEMLPGPRPDQGALLGPRPDQLEMMGPRPDQLEMMGPRPDQLEMMGPRPDQGSGVGGLEMMGPRPDQGSGGGFEMMGPRPDQGSGGGFEMMGPRPDQVMLSSVKRSRRGGGGLESAPVSSDDEELLVGEAAFANRVAALELRITRVTQRIQSADLRRLEDLAAKIEALTAMLERRS